MTSIGIIGMGKMGQTVHDLLSTRGDIIIKPIKRLTPEDTNALNACDVVIEFTTPDAAPGVIKACIEAGIPVVSGTTGWHVQHLPEIMRLCNERHGKFLYATNFSVGMNIIFNLNEQLASIMKNFSAFQPSITEIHHVHKKDAPSGTAITLSEAIFRNHHGYKKYVLNSTGEAGPETLPVSAIREGEVKGFHEVTWKSSSESLSLRHEAFDRRIFGEGAILASTWLMRQPEGVYTMRDVIRFYE